jgi:hypothetical protein
MTSRSYKFRRPILAIALYGMGVLALAALPPTGGATEARANEPAFIMGTTTKVINGSTIAVGGVTLRVEGIYTPVPGEIYGHTAKVYTERGRSRWPLHQRRQGIGSDHRGSGRGARLPALFGRPLRRARERQRPRTDTAAARMLLKTGVPSKISGT